ncbi:MAG: SUMF1/EgtB/PvdO family nonheme iron enzyme [Sedimenticola sp.]
MNSEVASSAEKTAGKIITERYLAPVLDKLDFWSRKTLGELKKRKPGWLVDYLDYLIQQGKNIDGDGRPENHVGEAMDQPLVLRLAYLTPRLSRLSAGRGENSQPTGDDGCTFPEALAKTGDLWQEEDVAPDVAAERLDAIPAMFIKGGPGSGKSTLSRWLASRYAALWMRTHAQELGAAVPTPEEIDELSAWGQVPFPIFVEFAGLDLDGDKCDLGSVVERHIRKILKDSASGESVVESELNDLLKRPLLLIFDALDQVPDRAQRKRLVEWLSSECRRLRQRQGAGDSMLVFTCRSQADIPESRTNFINNGCITWQLNELADEEIPDFVLHWMHAWEVSTHTTNVSNVQEIAGNKRDDLMLKLECIQRKNQKFGELLRVPLLLDLVCRLSKYDVDIPDQRALVFGMLIELSLKSWQRKLQLDENTCTQLIGFCEHLAWHAVVAGATGGTTDGGNAMSYQFVSDQARHWCQQNPAAVISANEMVKLLKGDVSFLVRETHSDYIRFTHQQFQEFLAARYLLTMEGNSQQLSGDDRWIQVVAFAAEMATVGTQTDLLWHALQNIDWLAPSSRPFLESLERFSTPSLLLKLVGLFGQRLLDSKATPRDRAWAAIWFHRLRIAAAAEWQWSELKGLIANPALDNLARTHLMMLLPECPEAAWPKIIKWLTAELSDDTDDYLNHSRALALSMLGVGWALEGKSEFTVREERDWLNDYLYVSMKKGDFRLGHKGESDNPPRTANSKPCRIRRFPVTRAEYARFMQTTAFQQLLADRGGVDGSNDWDQPRYWDDPDYRHPGSPVVGVSWFEARACAHAMLAREGELLPSPDQQSAQDCPWLPAETEWERAASWDADTDKNREYPWGHWQEASLLQHANIDDSGLGQTSPVIAFPLGKSPVGCYEMSGNVWEWQANWSDKSETSKGLRGGAFFLFQPHARCASRLHLHPEIRGNDRGFRPARTVL